VSGPIDTLPNDATIQISTVNTKAQERQGILNAAHLLYHEFWGENINNLLDFVPGHPNVKYLATEPIASLNGSLVYIPSILLVRKEYEDLYDALWSYETNRTRKPLIPGGVVVAGQPGIGKHVSLTMFSFDNKTNATRL
jgi:hypothetical protein